MSRGPAVEKELARAVRGYRRDGFVVLRSPFHSGELEGWRAECDRLAAVLADAEADDPHIQSRGRVGGGTVRDRYDPLIEVSPPFRELAGDLRVRSIARAILGDDPALLKDRLILKAAGTEGYGLHRDWPYWAWMGIPADEIVSLMVCIDAADEASGAIEVFPGLHRSELPAAAEDPRDLDPAAVEGRESRLATARAGDVLLLHPMAPHRSGPNLAARSRRTVTFVFTSARHAGARERYYADRPPY